MMITYKSDSERAIVEIAVEGKITLVDIEEVFAKFKADVARCGKVKVLETIGRIDGIEPSALWQDLKLGLPMMNAVSHAALVTDQTWINVLTDVAQYFLPAKVRHFASTEAGAARAWLEAA